MKTPKPVISISVLSVLFIVLFLLLRCYASTDRTAGVIVLYLLLGALYIIFFRIIRKQQAGLPPVLFALLFGTGLLCRLLLFGLAPQVLSDDVYRYLWDGKVQNAGINPYLYAPEDSRLDSVGKGGDYLLINHPEFPTSYPPAAQHFFRLLYRFSGWNLNRVRFVYLVLDLICFLLIFQMVKKKAFSFLYFLSPLVIIETFLGLHLDILGVLLMVGVLWFLARNQYYPAIACLAASVLTKYVFLAAAPVLLSWYIHTGFKVKAYGKIGKVLDSVLKTAFFMAVLFGISFPFIKAGPLLFKQLVYYVEYWEFNAPLFSIINRFFPVYHSFIRGALLGAGTIFVAFVNRVALYDRLRLCILLLLLLNGVLYPWYLIWLIPFFVYGDRWGELALVSLIPVSYYILSGYKAAGTWSQHWIITAAQYIPFLIFIIIDFRKGHYVQREKDRGYYSGPQRGRFTSDSA